MKKVLVPTDFSDNAKNAFGYAVQLSGIEGYEYVLLNSYKTPTAGGGMLVSLDEVLEKEGIKDLKREKLILEERFPGVQISLKCRLGELDNAIRRTNIEEQVDYVIMGTQGASGLQKVLVGSNTQRVIQNVIRPVLAIPENYTFKPLKKILFAADLKTIKNRSTLAPVLELADKFSAEVLILHVLDSLENKSEVEEEKNRLELDELFENVSHSYHVEVNKDTVEGINNFINQFNIDLLAMVPRKVSFIESFFRKSVTETFTFQANIPLLAVKDKDDEE